jgi:hypothetical protein
LICLYFVILSKWYIIVTIFYSQYASLSKIFKSDEIKKSYVGHVACIEEIQNVQILIWKPGEAHLGNLGTDGTILRCTEIFW